MNGIRPTVGIEFDDKYTNAKSKLCAKSAGGTRIHNIV